MTEARIIPLHAPLAARGLAERDDDELMVLVRAGVGEALAVLVARYHARLVSFCAKRTGELAAAEELVQETFLRLWRQRDGYRAEGKLAVLLYTTARNLCANHGRWRRRRARWMSTSEPTDVAAGAGAAPEHLDALLADERRREVERAVSDLPIKLREAVVLRFEHALGYDQISAIVGANESTVRSRVHLGLREIRMQLARGDA